MAKNDFDIDFDFEKEYGFDPKAILDSEFNDEDLDLSEFDTDALGIDLAAEEEKEPDYSDFDVDDLDLEEAPEETAFDEDEFVDEVIPEEDAFSEADFGEDYDEGDDLLDFSRRESFFDAPVEEVNPAEEEVPAYEQAAVEEEITQQLQQMQEQDMPGDEMEDLDDDSAEEEDAPSRRRPSKPRQPIKLTVPPFLTKLVALYMPPKEITNPQPDPNNPRRRRRKSKLQIFKEAYLPAILAVLTLVMVFTICVGALGNAIERKKMNDQAAKESSEQAALEADRVAIEASRVMEDAKLLAAGYNYSQAIEVLNSFTGNVDDYPEMVALKSEYVNAMGKLVEWNDPNAIPNLSFHVLIEDPARAFSDGEYGGLYNRNFVTTEEFSRILQNLYANNYVLVDYDSFVSSNAGTDGTQTFFVDGVQLPEGKKPVMITETMVNYFNYMIDKDNDGAYGDGFASKLVVTPSGDVKAEYVDANGQTLTGDYDLVPILETFIKAHPDFSYQGARAILAVTGSEGIFGYRINTSVISTQGNDYYSEQVAGAQRVVDALREKGYTMACFTYGNVSYKEKNANQISADVTSWTNEITPVIGEVDVLVYARTCDIGDYTGNKFTVLYNAGFRYFVTNGDEPSTSVNSSFVKQTRLMVTGENMAWKASNFADLFDCNTVINLTARGGSVPH